MSSTAASAAPTAAGRRQLFLDDAAFTFDFSDSLPAPQPGDEGPTTTGGIEAETDATAVELLGKGSGPVPLGVVRQTLAACDGAGHRFISTVTKDQWPELRQRHRDCVQVALRRATAARKARRAAITAGKAARGGKPRQTTAD